MASEQLPPDDRLRCWNPLCRNTATVAVVKTYPGAVPDPYCDQCAVGELMKVPAELGWHIISLADWRERMQPRADEALQQLAGAKMSAPARPPAALTAGTPPPPVAPEPHATNGPDPEAQAPEPPPHPSPRRRAGHIPWIRISLTSMGISLPCLLIGTSMNGAAIQAGTGTASGAPFIIIAAILFFWPFLALAIWVTAEVTKEAAADYKKYAAWKKTLTPEQLSAVHLAEAAALTGAAYELHRQNNSPEAKQRRQDLTDQIVYGGAPGDYRLHRGGFAPSAQQPAPPPQADPTPDMFQKGPQPRIWQQPQ